MAINCYTAVLTDFAIKDNHPTWFCRSSSNFARESNLIFTLFVNPPDRRIIMSKRTKKHFRLMKDWNDLSLDWVIWDFFRRFGARVYRWSGGRVGNLFFSLLDFVSLYFSPYKKFSLAFFILLPVLLFMLLCYTYFTYFFLKFLYSCWYSFFFSTFYFFF